QRYVLERAELDARYRDMQRSVHPDRYASASDLERRISMQQATKINEAYEVLKDPLKRGRYLLELRGHAIEGQQSSHQDPAFLMQQMELREILAEIREQDDPLQALHRLGQTVRSQYEALESELVQTLDGGGEIEQAVTLVLRMQFFKRLQEEVQELEADLEDEYS
ncbi:MAG: Fe-S protein assembly co-chaperone HscB, partial [Pseudomonadota bacterium]|nr:Fe-S protein assembly co-chaperone HscB [Pseudomonadota bacterium]